MLPCECLHEDFLGDDAVFEGLSDLPPPPPSPSLSELGERLCQMYFRWQAEEQNELLSAVGRIGTKWKQMAATSTGKGRSPEALRAAFNRVKKKKR